MTASQRIGKIEK